MIEDWFTLRLGRADVRGDSVALRLIRHEPGQARGGRCRASLCNYAPHFAAPCPAVFAATALLGQAPVALNS